MGWGAALAASSVGLFLFLCFTMGGDKWSRLLSILHGWFTRN
jgi:hypothetical protein